MSQQERAKWDERFRTGDHAVKQPDPFLEQLEEYSDLFPEKRRALDVACGAGRNAEYLAKRGWNVTACDIPRKGCAGRGRWPQSAAFGWSFSVRTWKRLRLARAALTSSSVFFTSIATDSLAQGCPEAAGIDRLQNLLCGAIALSGPSPPSDAPARTSGVAGTVSRLPGSCLPGNCEGSRRGPTHRSKALKIDKNPFKDRLVVCQASSPAQRAALSIAWSSQFSSRKTPLKEQPATNSSPSRQHETENRIPSINRKIAEAV